MCYQYTTILTLCSIHPLHLHLHSFPTRRSSDLARRSAAKSVAVAYRSAGFFTSIFEMIRSSPVETFEFTSRNRSEEHTSELQSQSNLVCRLLLEKKK